jgi:hypothetical protein
MEPWTYTDGDKGELVISTCNPGEVTVQTQGNGSLAVVMADDLPEVTAKLYEACGLPAPVILARPGTEMLGTPDLPVRLAGFRIWRGGSGVCIDSTAAFSSLSPDVIRTLAAVLAVHAGEAEAEPDPAEVDGLAAEIMRVHNPGAMGLDGARPLARTFLLWQRNREAGNASA